jgi:hypothetical protein
MQFPQSLRRGLRHGQRGTHATPTLCAVTVRYLDLRSEVALRAARQRGFQSSRLTQSKSPPRFNGRWMYKHTYARLSSARLHCKLIAVCWSVGVAFLNEHTIDQTVHTLLDVRRASVDSWSFVGESSAADRLCLALQLLSDSLRIIGAVHAAVSARPRLTLERSGYTASRKSVSRLSRSFTRSLELRCVTDTVGT